MGKSVETRGESFFIFCASYQHKEDPMTIQKETDGFLDLLSGPGFTVKDNIITQVNSAARAMLISEGTDVRSLLLTCGEEYATFKGGCLYLQLNIGNKGWGTSVTRRNGTDLFLPDPPYEDDALQALALAACELRGTLGGALLSLDQMARHAGAEDPQISAGLALLNKSLNRTLRLIGNMSDAGSWPYPQQELLEMGSMFAEIFEKAAAYLEETNLRLTFQGLKTEVLSLADRQQLERAVLNILSNAAKVSPSGGTVAASLTRKGNTLRLSITDSGPGIADSLRGSLFSRYLRPAGIDSLGGGLGLGMVMVKAAAAAHGGVVLVDQPRGCGSRITLTLAIRESADGAFREPVKGPDYAGGRDHTLLELSDCLPTEMFQVNS